MRIAYLLMVHNNPAQVGALLRALPADSPVFVHVDARVPRTVLRQIEGLQSVHSFTMVKRYRCYWGRIGMVKATLELVRAALAEEQEWGYATLLSGADYPIKSNSAISEYLEEHDGDEWIDFWDLHGENPWKDAPGRFQAMSRVERQHIGAGRRILRSPWTRAMPYGLHPFGGPQWWTLSRTALQYVRTFVDEHPRYLRFMRGVFVPDECFFQIILANSPFRPNLRQDNLRLVVWDRPTPPWPAVLTSADLALLRTSEALYARKFSLSADPDVFAAIDAELRSTTKAS